MILVRLNNFLDRFVGSLDEAIADGCAETIGGRKGAQNHGAALGIQCAQTGVEIMREFPGRRPIAPREEDNARRCRDCFRKLGGQQDADSFAGWRVICSDKRLGNAANAASINTTRAWGA